MMPNRAQQLAIFHDDLKQSRRVTYAEWDARPWQEKPKERGSALDAQPLVPRRLSHTDHPV